MPLNNASVGMPTSSIMTGLLTQRKRAEFTKNTSQLFVKPTEEGNLEISVQAIATSKASDAHVNAIQIFRKL